MGLNNPETEIANILFHLGENPDREGLIEAAALLIKNPSMRVEMGQAAREHVKANFSLDRVAADYIGVYNKLLR